MKRVLSFVLALSLMFSLSITAFAAGGMKNFTMGKAYTGFADVPEAAWYHASVKAAFEYGLVKGSTPTTYNPTGTLTVAEAIVMADRIHILYHTGEDTLVNGTPWYQTYVDYALQNGIITEGAFDSYTRKITRAEMADIFTRALPEKEYTVINHIAEDCPADAVGHKFEDSIRTLYQAGILTGNDPYGTFTPDANIVRSEAAAIVSRIVDPTLRKQVGLLEQWIYEDIKVGIPYGAILSEPDADTADGGLELIHEEALVMVYEIKDATGGIDGMTIMNVPRDELALSLGESLGTASIVPHDIVWGSIPAYCFDYEISFDEEAGYGMLGHIYVFLQGRDMYMITLASVYENTPESIEAAEQLLKNMSKCVSIE